MIAAAVLVVVVGFLLVLGLTGGEDDSGGGGGQQAATTQTTTTKKQPKAKPRQQQPAPTGVNVKIAPIEPTYVCVDNGPGTAVVFENTLDAARTFRNPSQVRINLGKRSAAVTLNGEPVAVAESAEPIALDLSRDGSTELDAAEAPCA